MPGSVSLTGQDTIQIDDFVVADLADGDAVMLDFPDDIVTVKPAKNGNVIAAENVLGRKCNMTIRVLRGSFSDKFFTSRFQEQQNNLAGFIQPKGTFVKNVGDGKGNVSSDVYQAEAGCFQKIPGAKSNAEGDTEQSVTVWQIVFGHAFKVIQ